MDGAWGSWVTGVVAEQQTLPRNSYSHVRVWNPLDPSQMMTG